MGTNKTILRNIELPCGHTITYRAEFVPTIGEEIWCMRCGNYTIATRGKQLVSKNQLRIDNLIWS